MPVDALGDSAVVEELRRVRCLITRLEARSAELVDAVARRGIPEAEGFGSATGWLIALTGEPASVCRFRVGVARALRSMPITREAFASGELSEARVRLLVDCHRTAPAVFARDEALLVAQARSLPSRVFPQAMARWLRLADADGALADADQAFERRRLHVSATWAGMVRLDGDLDPESGSVVMTAVASLAEPAARDPEDGRSPQQRRADALVEICRRHLDSGDRPLVGGERPHLVVRVELATLVGRGERLVELATGPVTLEAVRRLACDSVLTRLVAGEGSQPLEVGRRTRVVPAAVRRSLDVRDRGCTHPGCDVPSRWCDAHHVVHWVDGGPTNLGNPSS